MGGEVEAIGRLVRQVYPARRRPPGRPRRPPSGDGCASASRGRRERSGWSSLRPAPAGPVLTSPRQGRNSGRGAPAQRRTRTGRRSASPARSSRRTTGSCARISRKSGVRLQPASETWERASPSADAMSSKTSEPSTSTCTRLPARGGGKLCTQSPSSGGDRARLQPRSARRRRWRAATSRSTREPTTLSSLSRTLHLPRRTASDPQTRRLPEELPYRRRGYTSAHKGRRKDRSVPRESREQREEKRWPIWSTSGRRISSRRAS